MVRKFSQILILLLVLFSSLVHSESIISQLIDEEDAFLPPDEAFQLRLEATQGNAFKANFIVAPGHYLYRSRMQITAEGAEIVNTEWPAGEMKNDPNFGDQEVYHHDLTGVVHYKLSTQTQKILTVNAKYQGCSEKGLCYAPIRKTFHLPITAALMPDQPVIESEPAAPPQPSATISTSQESAALLQTGNVLWIVLGFFGAGLLLSLTPCVLPMIPILSSIIVGQQQSDRPARSPFFLSIAYVMGMALTYTLAGIAAGLSGRLISQSLQNAWVLSATAVIFVLLSLSMFGLYDLKLPSSIENKMLATSQRLKGGEYIGVFIMGALSALIVSPCVAAPLAGALLYIGQTHNVVLGGVSLFALAMGMGVPLLFIGASAGKLIPKAGAWMDIVKHLFGFLMLGMAVWILSSVIAPKVVLALSAVLVSVIASYLWQLSQRELALGGRVVSQGFAWIGWVFAAALLVGSLSGARSVLQPLKPLVGTAKQPEASHLPFQRVNNLSALNAAIANANGKPVMLDFYADWCVACKEMEHETFTDAKVKAQLKNTVLLQADVTENNQDDQALLKAFNLYGPPGILFFDQQGQLMKTLTTVGFKNPTDFQAIIQQRDGCLTQTVEC